MLTFSNTGKFKSIPKPKVTFICINKRISKCCKSLTKERETEKGRKWPSEFLNGLMLYCFLTISSWLMVVHQGNMNTYEHQCVSAWRADSVPTLLLFFFLTVDGLQFSYVSDWRWNQLIGVKNCVSGLERTVWRLAIVNVDDSKKKRGKIF